MPDATSVLFGLEDEFPVLDVQLLYADTVAVIIEQIAREGACPAFGVLSSVVFARAGAHCMALTCSNAGLPLEKLAGLPCPSAREHSPA